MGTIQKTTVVLIAINLFLYPLLMVMGGFDSARVEAESQIGNFVNVETGGTQGAGIQDKLPSGLIEDTAIVGVSSLNLASPFKMIWDTIEFIFLVVVGGLMAIMLKLGIPILVSISIGGPFTALQILGLISFIRGYDL